jgi:hypothetical protein
LANGQEFSADKLLDMLSLSIPKFESHLTNKRYRSEGTEYAGDTAVKTYAYRPKKARTDSASRKIVRSVLKETFTLTYKTTLKAEYTSIIEDLKKKDFTVNMKKTVALRQRPTYTSMRIILPMPV